MYRLLTLILCASLLPTLASAQLAEGSLVINEFMADNDSLSGIADPDGGYPDWIEIYNGTDADISLNDVFLSDKGDDLLKWPFPSDTTIAADGYLMIWADDDEEQQGLHANFKLSRGGEAIYLSNGNGSSIDSVVFGEQTTNVSSSRVPNGTGPFVFQHSTPAYSNDTPVATREPAQSLRFSVFPNPVRDFLQISFPGAGPVGGSVEVMDLSGRVVQPKRMISARGGKVELDALPAGIYLVRVADGAGRTGVERVIKRD